jgi:hypothetical protein
MAPRKASHEDRRLDRVEGKIGIPSEGKELSSNKTVESSIGIIRLKEAVEQNEMAEFRCDYQTWQGPSRTDFN